MSISSHSTTLFHNTTLFRSGSNDLADAMRRIRQPIEATADVKPGDEGQRFSMHAFGAVFVEVAVDPDLGETRVRRIVGAYGDRKSTRLNSSHLGISYAVLCL